MFSKFVALLPTAPRIFAAQPRFFSRTLPLANGEFEWTDPKSEDDVVNITYITRDGSHKKIRGKVGDNVMYLAHRYDIEVEGACEASLACCTCHVYVDESFYDKLPEPKEEEEDMLDLAPVLKPNSRLSCQIILNKELEGITVTLPRITRNFYVDGHKPEPH
uniref:2Fe-2S ferredoxin-type domain-containing protein n=1 Tax=Panagrellus redivivus TaxID=6233 RepID=A0A7E4VM84_PANRE